MSTSPKKPPTLSFNSPRTSPFKRPEIPVSQSPSALRQTIPSPSKPLTFELPQSQPTLNVAPITVARSSVPDSTVSRPIPAKLEDPQPIQRIPIGSTSNGSKYQNSDAFSRLHPAQVRELRESFQVLDRDNDGQVTREDVAEVLMQLGLDSSQSTLHPYFPSNSAATLSLQTYLSSISHLLASLSPQPELAAAFAAFDLDDSGQIDVDDLRDTLLHAGLEGGQSLTAQELDRVIDGFRGRRTLAKGMFGKEATKRGDVFRYKEFLGTIAGNTEKEAQSVEKIPEAVQA